AHAPSRRRHRVARDGGFPQEFLLKKNDVIIAMTEQGPGLLGSPALVPADEKYLHNQRIGLINEIDNTRIDKEFIYRLFYTAIVRNEIFGSATGTKVKHTAPKRIYSIEVEIPPLPTQRRIASILSAYDDLIENNLKRIKLLEEAINIYYKKLLSIGYKNFTNEKLNSFVDIISGFPFKSNYYNDNGKHKIVTIKNDQDGFFVPVVTDRIEDLPDNMNKALFLSTGDVIMSLTGNVGRVCLVYGDDYVLNQRVVKLSSKEPIDQSFIYALVRDKEMLTILENLSNGTAQQNLSPIKMGELLIRYPSSNLREDFNKKVSPMIEMICKLNIQNTKLREARDILLPRLMNGEIEV
ncbi:MAG TPA: restriction endonuclease subunit S, partial [Candidatus Kapabacteria bacterium]|nr:restriction endonuclease subunit S [Candidatus Kapabacteria bacterium]